ncbi:hypothetical protein CPB83DRAFT_834290 [Crepidotus variabilis]|uniref:F-box domain-containing protein n=1 Tax=Crepidotus variabilis TaxID=179855 RepID=A0A9P6EJ55_9AGAR|nr:hypothetical protein CPB83DRAFT_834290 [Crepidotus variabilis]
MTEESVPPIGAELTIQQLFQALRWKFKMHENELKYNSSESERIIKPTVYEGMSPKLKESISVIKDAHRFIAELAAFQNNFASINRLPMEVMAKILGHVQEDSTAQLSEFPLDRGARPVQLLSWLKTFTAVCQYWRRITLSNPSFWNTILVNSFIPTNLFFARSSSSPLQIVVTSLPSEQQHKSTIVRFVSLFKSNVERLERLTIIDSSAFKNHSFRYLLRLPFPNVHTFELDCGGDYDYVDPLLPEIYAPKLERLALYHCNELWSTLSLLATSRLTELSLFYCDRIMVRRYSNGIVTSSQTDFSSSYWHHLRSRLLLSFQIGATPPGRCQMERQGWGHTLLARRNWSTHFSSVEHLHIEPDRGNETIQDLLRDLERLQNPMYPNLVNLNIWLRHYRSIESFLNGREKLGSNEALFNLTDIVDETGYATRIRENGSTYAIQLHLDDDGPALFSWDWMLAQSVPVE